jgi:hypothetical protein
MSLSHKHVGSKIPAKINTFMLTRAELLIHLCYEIPCIATKYYFSLNLVIVRLTKIMNRADKNWAQFWKIKYLKNENFQKDFLIKVGLLV